MPLVNPIPKTSQVGNIDYSVGDTKTFDSPTSGFIIESEIVLTFDATVNGLGASINKWGFGAALIRNFEMVLNGTDKFIDLSGAALLTQARLDTGVVPMGNGVISTATDKTYELHIPIMHTLPWSKNPYQAGLDLRNASSLQYRITWGDISDIFRTPGTASISNVSCKIVQRKIDNISLDFEKPLLRELTMQKINVVGTIKGWNDYKEQRTTNLLIRSHTLVPVLNSVEAVTVLRDGFKVQHGSETFREHDVDLLQSDYLLRTGSEVPSAVYPVPYEMHGTSEHAVPTNNLDSPLVLTADVYASLTLDTDIFVMREALRYQQF